MPYETGIRPIPSELAEQIAGHPIHNSLLIEAAQALSPIRTREFDEAVEIVNMFNINETANRIEAICAKKNLPAPTVFGIHSLGWPSVFEAEKIGEYGKTPFTFIPPTDIAFHEGTLSVGKIDRGHTYLGFIGRSDHPYEWEGTPYGNRMAAFPVEVILELYRRGRERGEQAGIILTYIAGVIEKHPLQVGDIAVIIDDAESGTSLRPGNGSQKVRERITQASRFQPKLYRASTTEYARAWFDLCEQLGVPTGAATVMGTLGSPEFQSFQDMALGKLLFDQARKMGLLDYSRDLYPQKNILQRAKVIFDRRKQPSPIFGMGESFELAVLRRTQVHADPKTREVLAIEPENNRIAAALITDPVGRTHAHTRHESFDEVAKRTEQRNLRVVENFAWMIINGKIKTAPPPPSKESHLFSLKAYFDSLK